VIKKGAPSNQADCPPLPVFFGLMTQDMKAWTTKGRIV